MFIVAGVAYVVLDVPLSRTHTEEDSVVVQPSLHIQVLAGKAIQNLQSSLEESLS